MELRDFLLWLFADGGGAAIAAYWLMERLSKWVTSAAYRRYLSLALAPAIAWVAFAGAVALGYVNNPGDAQGWLEMLFTLGFTAVIGSQGAHGYLKLRE